MKAWTVLVLLALGTACLALERPSRAAADATQEVVSYRLEHQLGEGQWAARGRVNLVVGPGRPTINMEAGSLSVKELQTLKAMLPKGDLYKIRLVPFEAEEASSRNHPMAYVPACSLAAAGFRDIITLHVDPYGSVISLGYTAATARPQHPLVPCPDALAQAQKLSGPVSFQTTAKLAYPRPAERPQEVRTLRQLEDEMVLGAQAGGGGEQGGGGQQKSFFAKYWMYIVPFGLFMLLQVISPQQQEGAAQGGGGAVSRR